MTAAPRLYADSAVVDEIAPLLAGKLIHGVTTNPTILERADRTGAHISDLYDTWSTQGADEIFFQAWGADEAMLEKRAREILALGPRAVVKVPATATGFPVAARLAHEGNSVLLTAVYAVPQALAAAAAGVRYIAPYLGRLRDAGHDGLATIAAMQSQCAGSDTDVLAASIRSPQDLVDLRDAGVRHLTANPAVLREALVCEASDEAAAAFEATAAGGSENATA
ncbi:transaldolase family protein [Microbacterium karelineae]|uniref:transaldolase family protein n=1 Tax=Microbacterium karelineae TaxID=2654283 RepID=UPI0012EA0468|nr:transaldolase family protein [Microbacterium karelineae]